MIREVNIGHVRHLSKITIPVIRDDNSAMCHLLLTGKNGSGKTSVLEAIAGNMHSICQDKELFNYPSYLRNAKQKLNELKETGEDALEIEKAKQNVEYWQGRIADAEKGIHLQFSCDAKELYPAFSSGQFILAFFKADRIFEVEKPQHVEKVKLQDYYSINDDPRRDFIKYIVDKKVSESLYQTKGENAKAEAIRIWFQSFERMMQEIYDDDTLILDFDVDSFEFRIIAKGRETFDFNTMSAGYAAVLDIAISIIMRMEEHTGGAFQFNMPGIVLIDELETHLHYELQKKILPFLCRTFPKLQFIISTHSAFILNSIENAVIYDLENGTLVKNGLSDVPYDGVIRGYFDVSTLSKELEEKFQRYKELAKKPTVSDDELLEMYDLSMYLDEIPDYLALDITTEYKKLKLEFEQREA